MVTDTKYYYQLLKYIANNPVKTDIVKNPGDYRWSAHAPVKAGDDSIVDVGKTLSYFPSPKSKVLEEYINLIEKDLDIRSDYGLVSIKESKKLSDSLDYILSSLDFPKEIIFRIKQGDKNRNIKSKRDCFIKKAHASGFKIKEIADHISFTYEGVRRVAREKD